MRWTVCITAAALAFSSSQFAFSMDDITKSSLERRAVEATIWSMPAVNTELMRQAFLRAGGQDNQIALWSRLPSWKNQTLTPNPDTVYLIPFFNTKEVGPMVLEVPPADGGSITANIDNVWQVALEDAGPSGADKGKGGKYLILPPGYQGKVSTFDYPHCRRVPMEMPNAMSLRRVSPLHTTMLPGGGSCLRAR
ncbi:DUF1254 domain-containing protein [Rhizobium leguminosarum]|uniref:DUF1254 domain-containing protein n=1 Tax=Rhizobium leguminosarum TaxID=384 RepID=UPI001AE3AB60